MSFTEIEKKAILTVANQALDYGIAHHTVMPVKLESHTETLCVVGASFVTLNINHQLRGCIGSLKAHQALIQDVSENAFRAAFKDSRFKPITKYERPYLTIHISVLSEPTPFPVKDEEDLLNQLKVGVDGLILMDNGHQSTFLPSVWESLKSPDVFLKHLKLKAGLSQDYWSQTIRFLRYHTNIIE